MSDKVDLDEAQRLVDLATPGPWIAEFDQGGDLPRERGGYDIYWETFDGVGYIAVASDKGAIEEPTDAEFIAAARSLVPDLIAELRELRGAGE